MAKVVCMDHPLIQHKVGILRRKELGTKEMDIIPIKGDVIQRDGSNWKVLLRRFMFDTEDGDYVKVYIEPYKR